MHGPTKIRNLDVSLGIEQQVLGLDISVNDLEREILSGLELILNCDPHLLAVAIGEGVSHLVDVAS